MRLAPVLQLAQPSFNEILLALALILGSWGVIYLIGRLGLVKSQRIKIYPLAIIYRIESVESWLDRLLVSPRLIKFFSDLSIFVSYILMVYVVWFLANNLINFFSFSPEFARLTLLIPGVTVVSPRILPYVLISMPVILILHEMMHGLVARVEKLKIKSGGFGLALLFILGFVEPDEDEFKVARPRAKARVLAAGSGANIALMLLLTPILLGTSTVLGAPPFPHMLPDQIRDAFYEPKGLMVLNLDSGRGFGLAGGQVGDIITAINGVQTKTLADLEKLGLRPGDKVATKVLRRNTEVEFVVTVEASPNSPSRGLLFIFPSTHYEPRFYRIPLSAEAHSTVFWIWLLSWAVGMFNMLPMKPLDGHGLLSSSLEVLIKNPVREKLLWAVSAGSVALLAGNLIASYSQGFFVL